MAKSAEIAVSDLSLDLRNFRTVPQRSEIAAVQAMIAISPRPFWALLESVLDSGFLPTQNIILFRREDGTYLVKEGNRRVACLKIALALLDYKKLDLPPTLIDKIGSLSKEWKTSNAKVPCSIFVNEEQADRIVSMTHGKNEDAKRDEWAAVAKARHNRDKNGAAEVALDLLEKYLKKAENVTEEQKARWAGKYNLTVLDEAIKKIAPRFGVVSSPELARRYPKIDHRPALDAMIHAIGMETLTFTMIRESSDFAVRFGLPPIQSNTATTDAGSSSTSGAATTAGSAAGSSPQAGSSSSSASGATTTSGGANGTGAAVAGPKAAAATTGGQVKTSATPISDERTVKKALRALKLFGVGRAKLESIRKESLKLKLEDNPIAFCFLLRSMFEISAKVYCDEQKGTPGAPIAMNHKGRDIPLIDVLQSVIRHLTQNNADAQMARLLHGAGTELGRPDGLLSVTSMNQLVHNPSFTLNPRDIPVVFANIYPLLVQMNKS